MPAANEKCGQHEKAIQVLEASESKQWEAINKLQNRLPVWATLLISILTFALGWTINFKKLPPKNTNAADITSVATSFLK